MLIVTNGNQTEPLIQFNNFQMEQEVNGLLQISFTSLNVQNNLAHNLLLEESVITVGNYDFRVKQFKENRLSKTVTAISTFFDLNDKRQNNIFSGTHTFNEFASFIFSDTGWTYSSDVSGSKFIENFGEANVIALVNALCVTYECEYEIRPNNHVHFAKAIGGDNDAQYRYGYNVQALSKNVDTTKLKTYIDGYGANGLYVSYTSPYEEKFGKREADPIHDDRYTNGEALVDHIKLMLVDYPEVTFELDSIELTDKVLGEKVWLIYEPLEIEFQTRILSQTKQFVNGELVTTKVVLGNTIPKTTTDILISQKVEIDESKKITRSKFEQTNDRITMEVERVNDSIGKLEITADEIILEVDKLNNSVAQISIKADQISANVNNRIDGVESSFNMSANQIELSVSNTDARVGRAESRITQTENQIKFEVVKQDEFTGRNITSKINMDPWAVSISADKINLNGAVMVNGSISGATSIQVTDNITVGNTLNIGQYWTGNYNINFGGGAGAMQIKAQNDQITLSAINGVRIPEGTLFMANGYAIGSNTYDLKLDHNGSNRLYVRKNGYEYGWINIVNQ